MNIATSSPQSRVSFQAKPKQPLTNEQRMQMGELKAGIATTAIPILAGPIVATACTLKDAKAASKKAENQQEELEFQQTLKKEQAKTAFKTAGIGFIGSVVGAGLAVAARATNLKPSLCLLELLLAGAAGGMLAKGAYTANNFFNKDYSQS